MTGPQMLVDCTHPCVRRRLEAFADRLVGGSPGDRRSSPGVPRTHECVQSTTIPGGPRTHECVQSTREWERYSPMRLEGAVCVVTGGGSGIGAALARRFAEEGAARVI